MWELLWPSRCAGCERTGLGPLCPTCADVTPRPLARPVEGVTEGVSLGRYDGPLGAAVRRAKFGPDRGIARLLGMVLAREAAALGPVSCVVPAPSTAWSRLRRGFATAAVLAAPVARALDAPCAHVLWLSPGPRQSASRRAERRRNLTGRLRASGGVSGHVLLIDDVLTTGATAAACARELLGAGARTVRLLTVCTTDVQIP